MTAAPAPSWAPDFLFRPEPIVWVQRLFGPGHQLPFRLLDLLATTWGVLFAVALALWLWGRRDAYALAAIVTVEALVNLALNRLVHVPRPDAAEVIKYEEVALGSFPSGHSFTITVLWGLLWANGRVPLWVAAPLVVGVAVGRMYLGVHHLADVVAGVLLGVLLVWGFRSAWPTVRGWLERRTYGFFAAGGALLTAAAGAVLLLGRPDNHFLWNSAALAAGGSLGLLAEYRLVRYAPAPAGGPRAGARSLLGLLGILPLLAADRLTGEGAVGLGAALVFAGALWAFVGAPALFRRLRWDAHAGQDPPSRGR